MLVRGPLQKMLCREVKRRGRMIGGVGILEKEMPAGEDRGGVRPARCEEFLQKMPAVQGKEKEGNGWPRCTSQTAVLENVNKSHGKVC